MGEMAIPMMVAGAGSGLQAFSAIKQGQAASEGAQFQAQQLQQEQMQAETAANQSEAARSRRLTSALSNISNLAGSRGVAGYSPSTLAMEDNTTDLGMQDIRTDFMNRMVQASNFGLQSQQDEQAGSEDEMGGLLRGGASLLQGAGSLYKLYNG